jgi:hypothetical protein
MSDFGIANFVMSRDYELVKASLKRRMACGQGVDLFDFLITQRQTFQLSRYQGLAPSPPIAPSRLGIGSQWIAPLQ